jgi:pimeloyl-ACP methyl ester carboxylesterase
MKRIIWKTISFTLILFLYKEGKGQLKPQTPTGPFDYIIDSVEYDNADKTVHLGATLTYPKIKGPFTTLLLISGSGQQDRDATIFGHKPFAVLADYFTRQGFAVLRVDDRGKGKSKGNVLTATSEDFAEDAITSLQYLLTRKEVDPAKLGVIGHSEGGFIAPIVYSKFPKLAFIVSMAGTGVSGAEILLKQQTDPVKPISEKAYNAFYELTQKTLFLIHDNPEWSDIQIIDSAKKIYSNWKKQTADSLLTILRADKASAESYGMQVKQQLIPWLRYFITTNPSFYWQQVKCPVLAINGDRDIQVYASENLTAIRKAVLKSGNKKIVTRTIKGHNHLFQRCTLCTVEEYAKLDESFSPAVMKIVSDWIKKNTRHTN